MTRSSKSKGAIRKGSKARFSELVRKVRTDGPQHVTVHGRDEWSSPHFDRTIAA